MIYAVSNRVDEIFSEHAGGCTIILDKVKSGFFPVFIVSVQFHPFIVMVILNVFIDKDDVIRRNVIIRRNPGFPDGFIDYFIHPVGIVGGFSYLCVGDVPVKSLIGHDRIGDSVKAGTGC